MFRWILGSDPHSRSYDAPSESQSARDDRKNLGIGENYLFLDLVVAEVELSVIRFEISEEHRREEERKRQRKPDYTWLITNSAARPKKYLTVKEKNRVENACERLKPSEWSKTIDKWKNRIEKSTTREDIIEQFLISCHETIQSRTHEPTIGEVFRRYTTGRSNSLNQVGHANIPSPINSSRTVNELSFIELHEIV